MMKVFFIVDPHFPSQKMLLNDNSIINYYIFDPIVGLTENKFSSDDKYLQLVTIKPSYNKILFNFLEKTDIEVAKYLLINYQLNDLELFNNLKDILYTQSTHFTHNYFSEFIERAQKFFLKDLASTKIIYAKNYAMAPNCNSLDNSQKFPKNYIDALAECLSSIKEKLCLDITTNDHNIEFKDSFFENFFCANKTPLDQLEL